MDFIQQMRCFEKLSAENLTPNAIAIYWKLFMIDNNTGWKEWFTVSDYWLGLAVGISRSETIVKAINLLKQRGFIDFERGTKRNIPTKYKIIVLNNSTKDSTEDSIKSSTKDSTKRSSQDRDIPKQETKTKNIDPRFDVFWEAYPKHKGKEEAKKAFAKISLSDDLFRVMLSAIEASKNTEGWKKDGGQYIPYPSTWLNQKRWEDEFSVNLQTAPQMTEEQKAELAKKREEEEAFYAEQAKADFEREYGGITNESA